MSLQGVLTDFGVADIFQLIAQQRKSGILEVTHGESKIQVHFVQGGVLRALPAESRPDGALAAVLIRTGMVPDMTLADVWHQQETTLESLPRLLINSNLIDSRALDTARTLLTDEAIFELFLWDDGHFSFQPSRVEVLGGDAAVGAEMVLLDALRMRDEWPQIEARLRNLSGIPVPEADIEGFRSRRDALSKSSGVSGPELERIFTLVDGRLSARRVIDLSRMGTFHGGKALVALIRENLLSMDSSSFVPDAPARSAPVKEHPAPAYAVLVICSVLAIFLLGLPAPRSPDSYPLSGTAMSEIQAAVNTQQLRAVLETYHWAKGHYPESLEGLERIEAGLLATRSVDQYSYARSAEGYSLQRRVP